MKKIYVGNLPWSTRDEELEALFAQFGTVQSAKVVTDARTGRSRGFGFVEMEDDAAEQAINKLNGTELESRQLRINEAMGRSQSASDRRW